MISPNSRVSMPSSLLVRRHGVGDAACLNHGNCSTAITTTGNPWQPRGFGCAGDQYNRATFDPVETDALRLEVQLPEHFSTGIHEWRVEEAQK